MAGEEDPPGGPGPRIGGPGLFALRSGVLTANPGPGPVGRGAGGTAPRPGLMETSSTFVARPKSTASWPATASLTGQVAAASMIFSSPSLTALTTAS
jgi:hypothetical protein